jgi:hypothetical protein
MILRLEQAVSTRQYNPVGLTGITFLLVAIERPAFQGAIQEQRGSAWGQCDTFTAYACSCDWLFNGVRLYRLRYINVPQVPPTSCMRAQTKELWLELCEQAANEQDPNKFRAIFREIFRSWN